MKTHTIGIIMNGVTGRMGMNQHLVRSVLAIRDQGGVRISPGEVIMPDPILTGRNATKLQELADQCNLSRHTTDLNAALADSHNQIFFDASSTLHRARFIEMAVKAGKAIYCEKPTAVETKEAVRLYQLCRDAGVKNGVVQDKLWLPGMRKLKMLTEQGFFGKILSVRGQFGYWVFSGHVADQPMQRPSWNYRKEDGGGMMIDMFCHWRYVIDNLFGPVKRLCSIANVDIKERIAENGEPYKCTADDSAYAFFQLEDGTICQFNSSWCTRVRRDDLLTIQVDGTHGSAVAGMRECWVQGISATPKPIWNPDIPQPINFHENWGKVPRACEYDNAFKVQWELFLRHVVKDEPFPWNLLDGAKGVQLAELGQASWTRGAWVDVPSLEC